MAKGKPIQNAQDSSEKFFALVSSCVKQKNYEKLRKKLQDFPTLLTSQDSSGKNILHKIAEGEFDLEVLRVIEQYIKPEQVSDLYRGKANDREGLIKKGDTPLTTSAWANNVDLMAELLNSQDRIFQKINYNKGELLEEREITVKANGRNGQTALHAAGFHGSTEMIKYLINNGAEIFVSDQSGYRPMHTTIRNNLSMHDKSSKAIKNAHDTIKLAVPLLTNNSSDLLAPIIDSNGKNQGNGYGMLARVNKWDQRDTKVLEALCNRAYEDKTREMDQPVVGLHTGNLAHQRNQDRKSSSKCAIL